ncbi:hypothetical protein [Methylobacterium tardum]|uniref:Uncharacterized protein n=1 Tax=Methylobacterium tardum TaxID=374432 RepID=A0AA37TF28_9HYPH|nr:hypothetical protein [Methylobacterium tardum]URD36051.1 hypothetical protein M6G65_27080 [Methylobacterium tardum]GLS69002.1 hypothetical protein GCM10007890_10140 [Methylobacterium tardum]
MKANPADIDDHTAWLIQQIAINGPHSADAATAVTIEKLHRLEDLARNAGTSRQAFQKIVSARRVLGDHSDLSGIPAFAEDAISVRPVPECLRIAEHIPPQGL